MVPFTPFVIREFFPFLPCPEGDPKDPLKNFWKDTILTKFGISLDRYDA